MIICAFVSRICLGARSSQPNRIDNEPLVLLARLGCDDLLRTYLRHTAHMIHVIATITCTPGNRAKFLTEFHRVVPLVLQEDGCVAYGPTIDQQQPLSIPTPKRPDVVVVVEQWRDIPALQAHLVAPHMLEYRKKVTGLVEQVAVQVLEPG